MWVFIVRVSRVTLIIVCSCSLIAFKMVKKIGFFLYDRSLYRLVFYVLPNKNWFLTFSEIPLEKQCFDITPFKVWVKKLKFGRLTVNHFKVANVPQFLRSAFEICNFLQTHRSIKMIKTNKYLDLTIWGCFYSQPN